MNPNPIILCVWFGDDPAWSPIALKWVEHTRGVVPDTPILMVTDRVRPPLPGVEQVVFDVPLLPFRPGANGRGLIFDRKAWLVLAGLELCEGRAALYLDHDAELQRDPFPELLAGPCAASPLVLPPDPGPRSLPVHPPVTMRCAGIMWLGLSPAVPPGQRWATISGAFRQAFHDLGPGMEFDVLREQAAWSVAAYRLSGDTQLPVAFNWVPCLYSHDRGRAAVLHWHANSKFDRHVSKQPAMTVPA